MQNITDLIHRAAITISDHGNTVASKSLQYFGIGGSSVGGATWFASGGGGGRGREVVEQGLALSDWGAIVGIVGGITLIIKNGIDIYFAHKRNKRESDAHKRGERK